MKEEKEKKETQEQGLDLATPQEVVPAIPELALDIIQKGRYASQIAEAYQKIKRAFLKLTNSKDWVQLGKNIYLCESGISKLILACGISYSIEDVEKIQKEDGEYEYIVKVRASMGNSVVENIGTCSSKDKFFRIENKEEKPLEMVNEVDIRKKAVTNAIGRAISDLLGLKNLTIEDLKDAGLKIEGGVVQFDSKKDKIDTEFEQKKEQLKEICLKIANNDLEKAKEYCIEISGFTSKSGEKISGITWDKFSNDEKGKKWLNIVLGKAKVDLEKKEKEEL